MAMALLDRDARQRASRRSERQQVRDYFVAAHRPVDRAVMARAEWIKGLAPLLGQYGRENRPLLREQARQAREYGRRFQSILAELQRLHPPTVALPAHEAAVEWMSHLVAATREFDLAVGVSDTPNFSAFQRHIGDARFAARAFNNSQSRVLTDWGLLRRRAA